MHEEAKGLITDMIYFKQGQIYNCKKQCREGIGYCRECLPKINIIDSLKASLALLGGERWV